MNTPFKFLDAYTKADRAIFFGRDREIEEMYQKVFSSKILLIYGISGTGKTSLINCGLANKFEESDWLPVNVRRGGNIVQSLWKELEKVTITPVEGTKGRVSEEAKGRRGEEAEGREGEWEKGRIGKAIQSIYLDHFKPVYLIFDQFEELFIFGSCEEREEFIKIVKEVVDADIQCKFIFSIREEYLASVTEFELTIPEFLSNRMRLEKMTQKHAIEAIEGPCKVYGIEVEEGFPETLLNKLNPEGKDVELTYLQVFLDKMYKMALDDSTGRDSSPRINPGFGMTLSFLGKVGDVSDLLGSFLEEQVSELEDPETGLVVLKAFVSVKGTKRQITEEEVVEFSKTLGKPIGHEKLMELIQRFVNLRILRDKDENNRYELRHDSLASKIYEKITLVEKELMEVRQFIENALQTFEQRNILLSEKDLKYLQVYEDRLFLDGELKEFVDQSRKVIYAKRKAFNNILRLSLAGFILLMAGIGFYYYQFISETKKMERATKSILQAGFAPELGFQTALEAYRLDSTSSLAHYAIMNSFYKLLDKGNYYDSINNKYYDPYKLIFDFHPCNAEIVSAKFSGNGEYIYGWLTDNSVKVWERKGKEVFSLHEGKGSIVNVSLSGNGEYIAVIYEDSTGTLWNLENEKICDFPVLVNPVFNEKVIDFSPDAKFFAVTGINADIVLYELNGNIYQDLPGHSGNINYLSFSPDSRFIASASDDSTVIIWNYNKTSYRYGQYGVIHGHGDIVRSCNFSKSSKYILTASDDSTLAVWKLNGHQGYLFYFKDKSYDLLIGKLCNAEFLGNDRIIRVTGYFRININPEESNKKGKTDRYTYEQILLNENDFYILSVREKTKFISSFYISPDNYRTIRFVDYNQADNSFAMVLTGEKYTLLKSGDLLPLSSFNGIKPVYSPDGDFLLCIHDNELILYPVSVKELVKLVEEEMIFGQLIFSQNNWNP